MTGVDTKISLGKIRGITTHPKQNLITFWYQIDDQFWYPRYPVTFSEDDEGVYNQLRNVRYLGSMELFSVSVSQDP